MLRDARLSASRGARGKWHPLSTNFFRSCGREPLSSSLSFCPPSPKSHRDNRNCNYSGPNSRCYNECVGTGSNKKANERCAQSCRYIEVGCYNDCRIYDRATVCINDCEVNVKDNKVKTYNGSQHCLDECDHINNKNAREHCYEDCYSTSYDKEE